MEFFTDDLMGDSLASSLETADERERVPRHRHGPGRKEGAFVKWLTIRDRAGAVVDDVARIRAHPGAVPRRSRYTATSTT